MKNDKQIEYLENLRKSLRNTGFSKSNVKYLEELIYSEIENELNSEKPNILYLKHLKLTRDRSLNKLTNSRKNIENRIDEFDDCKRDLIQDIFHGLTFLK